jgi:hypothetical protein
MALSAQPFSERHDFRPGSALLTPDLGRMYLIVKLAGDWG